MRIFLSREKRIAKIYSCLFTFFFLMSFMLFSTELEASWGIQPYIEQIEIDLKEASSAAEGEADSEYARIAHNIGQMDRALQAIYSDTLSSLRNDENASLPDIDISSPLAPEFSRVEKLREEIRQQLVEILNQYNNNARKQYRQDVTFINNITKETINYGKDIIPLPSLHIQDVMSIPGDTQEKVENAKILKQNVNAIQETREIAKALHEEFERVKNGVFVDVNYYYKKLSTLTKQFDNVLEKHSWLEKGFADEIEAIRQEKEQYKKAQEYAEEAEQQRQDKADQLQSYTVGTYYIELPSDDKEREEFLAALRKQYAAASGELNNLISNTQRRYNEIYRQLYIDDGNLQWIMRWMNPERDSGGLDDVSKVSLDQLRLINIENNLENYPEQRRKDMEKLSSLYDEMSSLLNSYKENAAPILSTLRSLANVLGYGTPGRELSYRGLLNSISGQVSLMEQRLEELPVLIDNHIEWGNELSGELDRRISRARAFVSKYKSEYNSVVYAGIEYRNAVDEASKALQGLLGLNQSTALIWTDDGKRELSNAMNQLLPSYFFQSNSVYGEVKAMFKEGEFAKIRNHIENIKSDYSSVIEKIRIISAKQYAIALARNQVDFFISQNREDYNLASNFSNHYYASTWGSPLADLSGWQSDKIQGCPNTYFLKNQAVRLEKETQFIDELLEVMPTLESLDDYLAGVYNSKDYDDARLIYFQTLEELRELEDILDRWIDSNLIKDYDPETEEYREIKLYDIKLNKTEEAARRAKDRQQQEQLIEDMREQRNQLQELYQQGQSLQGYLDYYQGDEFMTEVNTARNSANHVLGSDVYSAQAINIANEIIDLANQIMDIKNRGPIDIVEDFYDRFASAYSDANIGGVMRLISRDWQSSDGERRRDIEDRLLNLFNSWDEFIVTIDVNSVSVSQRDGEDVLEVSYYISIEGISFEHDYTYTEQGNVTDILSISDNSFMIEYTKNLGQ